MNEWVNKPVAFKRTDPIDAERYKFAQNIPFTKLVKQMLDNMMNHRQPFQFVDLPVMNVKIHSEEIIADVIDDNSQFL